MFTYVVSKNNPRKYILQQETQMSGIRDVAEFGMIDGIPVILFQPHARVFSVDELKEITIILQSIKPV